MIERIPTYILMYKHNQDLEFSKKRLLIAINNYKSNLEELVTAPLNTVSVNQTLSQLLNEFISIDQINALPKEEITQMLSSYEDLFSTWNEVNIFYEQKMDFLILEKDKKNIMSRF